MADKKQTQIADGIRRLGNKGFELMSAYVKNVDESKGLMSVVCYENEQELDEVLLRGTDEEGTSGLLIIPKLNSDVVIGSVDGPGEWVLLRASEVDKVLITAGVKLEIHCDDVVINDGNNDGLVLVKPLTDRLNAIEEALAELKTQFNAHTHITSCGAGAGTAAATTAQATKDAGTSIQTDIENDKVKH